MTPNMSGIGTENPMTLDSSPTAPSMTKWHSAKLALGSVIMLASLTCTAISLAWAKMPPMLWIGSYPLPLYGLPYVRVKHSMTVFERWWLISAQPVLSLLWQSAEFYKSARSNRNTGFSAASHLICDPVLGVSGLVLAIVFLVFSKDVHVLCYDFPEAFLDATSSEQDFQTQPFCIWWSTVYMWCGMALVAAYMTFTHVSDV